MILGIIIGLFIGSGIGLFLAALLKAGRDDKEKPEVKTNYDRIRNMTVEEMAEFFCTTSSHDDMCSCCLDKFPACAFSNTSSCEIAFRRWLDSEVKE